MKMQEVGHQAVEAPNRKVPQADRHPMTRIHRKSTLQNPTRRSCMSKRRSGSANLPGKVGDVPSTKSSRPGRTRFASFPPSERTLFQDFSDMSSEVSLPVAGSTSSKRSNLSCTFCKERKIVCDRGMGGRDGPCMYVCSVLY